MDTVFDWQRVRGRGYSSTITVPTGINNKTKTYFPQGTDVKSDIYPFHRCLPDEGRAGFFTEYIVMDGSIGGNGEYKTFRMLVLPFAAEQGPAINQMRSVFQRVLKSHAFPGVYFNVLVGWFDQAADGSRTNFSRAWIIVCDRWRRASELTDAYDEKNILGNLKTRMGHVNKQGAALTNGDPRAFSLDNLIIHPSGVSHGVFLYDFSSGLRSILHGEDKYPDYYAVENEMKKEKGPGLLKKLATGAVSWLFSASNDSEDDELDYKIM